MDDIMLRADCAQCAALCCVALAFDRSALFAFDKQAGVACAHLDACNACAIHDDLSAHGFGGCVRYDCLGAGQRVTQMFGGQSWCDGPETARAMFDAFHAMRSVHDLILLLREAAKLPTSKEQGARRAALLARLSPDQGWTRESLAVFERSAIGGEVRGFLAGLRERVHET